MTRDRWCPNCEQYVHPRSRMKPWVWLIVLLSLLLPSFVAGLMGAEQTPPLAVFVSLVVSIGLVLSMRRVHRTLSCPRCETRRLLKEKPADVSPAPPA